MCRVATGSLGVLRARASGKEVAINQPPAASSVGVAIVTPPTNYKESKKKRKDGGKNTFLVPLIAAEKGDEHQSIIYIFLFHIITFFFFLWSHRWRPTVYLIRLPILDRLTLPGIYVIGNFFPFLPLSRTRSSIYY